MTNRPDQGLTQSVLRAADILIALGANESPVGVSALAAQCGLSPATTHRLLQSLLGFGLVSYDPARRLYGLGSAVLQLGLFALEHQPLRAEARPMLNALREVSGETVTLYVATADGSMGIEQAVTLADARRIPALGETLPFDATPAGRLLLAYQDERFIARYVTERIQDVAAREQLLRSQGDQGSALLIGTVRGDPPTSAAALPVRNRQNVVIAAVEVEGPPDRLTPERVRALEAELRAVVGAFRPVSARPELDLS
ncbi:MAG: IclR family transcriptional regulator [Vicinamibacterales bacterium]